MFVASIECTKQQVNTNLSVKKLNCQGNICLTIFKSHRSQNILCMKILTNTSATESLHLSNKKILLVLIVVSELFKILISNKITRLMISPSV